MLHAMRLRPGEDLYQALAEWVVRTDVSAAAVVTCVGSLTTATVRLAGAQETRTLAGPFEIVSLVGTLARDGVHLHIALSDAAGACVGGHLKPGSLVHTTAEIVVAQLAGVAFRRVADAETGYPELQIAKA